MTDFPLLGFGVGLRPGHYQAVLEQRPAVDWFEIISENFMVDGGNPRRVLSRVREQYPIVMHGVSLSLGAIAPLDEGYLARLTQLAAETEPAWISDHLCWSSFGGHTGHDLWPLPYTEEALTHLVDRIGRVQDRLKRRILVENVSSYVAFAQSTLSESAFLAELVQRADCGILLDVNNVYVSAHNHGFDAHAFFAELPADRVGQVHLAGHSTYPTHLLDTHDQPVCDAVWELYRDAVARFGAVSTLIEWDDQLPSLDRLVEEAQRARELCAAALIDPSEAVRRAG